MSPTENELRAFLREGEGDIPDAVSVISNAMRVREARRKRITTVLTSAAAAVVVIGGSVLLINAGGSNDESASSNAGGTSAGLTPLSNRNAAGGADRGTNSDKHQSMTQASVAGPNANTPQPYNAMMGLPMCPSSPTHLALPGGGGLNAFGADGKMWQQPPNAMRVCAYIGSNRPASRMIYGPEVTAIAHEVETASVTRIAGSSCPTSTPATAGRTIEIFALDANQNKLKPVVFDAPACGVVHATNGTASRYLTKLPAGVASTLAKAAKRQSPHR